MLSKFMQLKIISQRRARTISLPTQMTSFTLKPLELETGLKEFLQSQHTMK